jgi:hypothetical protein
MGNQITHFIVPLIFFALWALTWIFNKEAQGLPPRQPRPPEPGGGPRPSPRFAPRLPERRPSPPAPSRPPVSGRDDGIVILETEVKRPGPGFTQRPAKRNPKAKSTAAPASKKPQASALRPLDQAVAQAMTPLSNDPVALKPLEHVYSTIVGTEPNAAARATAAQPLATSGKPAAGPVPGIAMVDIRNSLLSRQRMRENLIIAELLGPPLAIRRENRSRI